MKNAYKIIISGLDYAGKTSILTALDKKYNFQKEITELKPTIKVEYHQFNFLDNLVFIWDMGGQKNYRDIYQERKEIYFAGTDLMVYVIDIQDKDRYEDSLSYLNNVLEFFEKSEEDVPIIISFHKYDPELRDDAELLFNINKLKEQISNEHPSFKILFQQSSIYDIISIVQLISYALSLFDEAFFELSELMEDYLTNTFNCTSLILFDENGIIISEFYSDSINPEIYVELIDSIKEHLFILKRMQEEDFKEDYNFFSLENKLLSYLHKINIDSQRFFISAVIEENNKDNLLNKFPELVDDTIQILESILL
ncbi:MAG: ADP-ribosylation factor-like protein [Candidatus Hermodarchaeota archaeon]